MTCSLHFTNTAGNTGLTKAFTNTYTAPIVWKLMTLNFHRTHPLACDLSTGEQTSDDEKGRDSDTQPENVKQIQKEQTQQRMLRGVFQKHARQKLALQRCIFGWTHVNEPPASFQPRRTHAPHPYPHTPLVWAPAPLQHGDSDGLRSTG